jgi:predicted nucleotidyltransferase
MSTKTETNDISLTLFGKTRRSLLSLLYSRTDESFYLRQLVRAAGKGLGSVQRELELLTGAGIIVRRVEGRQVYFQANAQCPVFNELKNLITKTIGYADTLRAALTPISDRVLLAFIYGSVARSEASRSSDIDIMVIGHVSFTEVVGTLAGAQEQLGREINPTVYSEEEFRSKVAAKNHFLSSVITKQLIFLIGEQDELERLAAKRLARRTQKQ